MYDCKLTGKKGLKMDLKNTGVHHNWPGCHTGDVGSTGEWGGWWSLAKSRFSPSLGGGGLLGAAGMLTFSAGQR